MSEDKEKVEDTDDDDNNEWGHIKCEICGAHDNVDVNDAAAMLQWFTNHVFGHMGVE
jgi:hypothetical protein